MLKNNDTKFCQSCIQRQYNPPNIASREWQTGIYYCDDCFNAVIDNLTNIAPAAIEMHTDSIKGKTIESGPVLDHIYSLFSVPKELQFDRVDTVQRNHDKIFNFHAPAIINRTEENLAEEIEQLACALFHIKYRIEPLEMQVKKLKEQRRKEKGLASYDDSKEQYAKVPKPKSPVKATQEEKMAKTLGMSIEEYRTTVAESQAKEQKRRDRYFNLMAGNCGECGGAMPCAKHPVPVGAK